jgi:hypothetical protein
MGNRQASRARSFSSEEIPDKPNRLFKLFAKDTRYAKTYDFDLKIDNALCTIFYQKVYIATIRAHMNSDSIIITTTPGRFISTNHEMTAHLVISELYRIKKSRQVYGLVLAQAYHKNAKIKDCYIARLPKPILLMILRYFKTVYMRTKGSKRS